MICYLYMIRCKDNTLYTGVSIDYLFRWKSHHTGIGAKYIRNNGFHYPVFLQEFPNKTEAMREERFIKKQPKAYKEELIKSRFNILNKEPDKPALDWEKQGYKGVPPWL
jgi:putative endonuclease